jgi:uncharacterized protein (TIGR04222 family)
MPEPWGISGPTFLWLYVIGLILAVIIAGIGRRRIRRTTDPQSGVMLGVDELAYLAGGPIRTVEAAIAGLIERGALRPSRRRRVQATGKPAQTPVEAAVLATVTRPGNWSVARITHRVADQPVVADIYHRLLARNLLIARAATFPRLLKVASPLFILAAIGIARLVNGLTFDRPVGFLTALLILTGAVTVPVMLVRTPWRSTAGDAVLASASAGRTSPGAARGPAMMAMGGAAGLVALGGLAAFPDPTIRAALGRSTAANSASSSSGCGTSSSCGSSSSCGGGGGGGCGG